MHVPCDYTEWAFTFRWHIAFSYDRSLQIAFWLRKHGYDCQVIDWVNHFNHDELYSLIRKFVSNSTAIIAVSTTFLCNSGYKHSDGIVRRIPEQVVSAIQSIKSIMPNLKVVFGGHMSDRLPSWGIADATVMTYTGSSEDVFLEYLEHLVYGNPEPIGEIVETTIGQRPEYRMFYHSARNPKYNIEHDNFRFSTRDIILHGEPLPLDVSRGCIFACRFCSYLRMGKKKLDYVRGMDYIRDEIFYNHENFGSTNYFVLDDTFNDTEWKISEFYKMTQTLPFEIDYFAYLRADLLQRFSDTPYMLKDSGLLVAFHGLESLNPEASQVVGKAWSGKHAREYIPRLYHEIWKAGVAQHVNFIVGLPGETESDIFDTANWFIDNNLFHIRYNLLSLGGKNNREHRYSVLSEFEKNPEKYGFRFNETPFVFYGTPMTWGNRTWTVGKAAEVTNLVSSHVARHNKLLSWWLPIIHWYGFSKSDVLTKYQNEIDFESLRPTTEKFLQQYRDRLMSL
jgi:Radical SAM superfamily